MSSKIQLIAIALLVSLLAAAPAVSAVTGVAGGDDTAEPQFPESTVEGEQGDTVSIPVALDANGSTTIRIGEEAAANFETRATVLDTDGDGEVTVTLDTSIAGRTSAEHYLEARGGEVREVEQRTELLESRLDAGEYPLEIGPGGAPSDTATLSLAEGPDPTGTPRVPLGRVALAESTADVASGGTAELPIRFDGTDRVRVRIGAADAVGFEATATVVDTDGDGRATVLFDTEMAGRTDASSYLSAEGGDVRNATQHSRTVDSRLDSGNYEIALGPDDDVRAVGSLYVTEGATTPTDSPTAATTTAGDSPEETNTTGAGFGFLVAVLALTGATLLARR